MEHSLRALVLQSQVLQAKGTRLTCIGQRLVDPEPLPLALLLHLNEDGRNVEKKWWGPGLRFWFCIAALVNLWEALEHESEFYRMNYWCLSQHNILWPHAPFACRFRVFWQSYSYDRWTCAKGLNHCPSIEFIRLDVELIFCIFYLHQAGWRYVFHVFFWRFLCVSEASLADRCWPSSSPFVCACSQAFCNLPEVGWTFRSWTMIRLMSWFGSEGQKHSSEQAWRGQTIWIWTIFAYIFALEIVGSLEELRLLLDPKVWTRRVAAARWSFGKAAVDQKKAETINFQKSLSTAYLNIAWANREIVNRILITSESYWIIESAFVVCSDCCGDVTNQAFLPSECGWRFARRLNRFRDDSELLGLLDSAGMMTAMTQAQWSTSDCKYTQGGAIWDAEASKLCAFVQLPGGSRKEMNWIVEWLWCGLEFHSLV